MTETIWEVPIAYVEFEETYTGWTKPIKFADDLPMCILSLSIRMEEYGDDIDEDDIRWIASSHVWVDDENHVLSPMFVNVQSNMGALLGGGTSIFQDWISNSYADSHYNVDELVSDCKAYTEYIVEDKPEWFIDTVREEIKEELESLKPTHSSSSSK